ncbi:hypothetical protein BLNAU_13973 [Blattamonas nauphoetae]|uniref:Uncharacterized protein n=1 Tax=Blattamonas nauphoetae TaxID=2049346 RepID=A0ABQ9XLV8_9EUKA|nr:hypothetical protein BLNAU_13973 [Blattamonas nauphoetae]
MGSNNLITAINEILGRNVKNSVSLCSFGDLSFNTPSSESYEDCHSVLKEGDCVRMEVDLDSTPRTVQFFVNGWAGMCYMSGLPSSVRIGFSVAGKGTSFRINNISRSASVCQNNAVLLEPAMTPNAWNPLACEQRSPPTDAESDSSRSEQVFSIVHRMKDWFEERKGRAWKDNDIRRSEKGLEQQRKWKKCQNILFMATTMRKNSNEKHDSTSSNKLRNQHVFWL